MAETRRRGASNEKAIPSGPNNQYCPGFTYYDKGGRLLFHVTDRSPQPMQDLLRSIKNFEAIKMVTLLAQKREHGYSTGVPLSPVGYSPTVMATAGHVGELPPEGVRALPMTDKMDAAFTFKASVLSCADDLKPAGILVILPLFFLV